MIRGAVVCFAAALLVAGVGSLFRGRGEPGPRRTPRAEQTKQVRGLPPEREFEPSLALSLTALQQAGKAKNGRRLPDDVVHLAGVNRIRGVIVAPDDVVLLGDAEPGMPPLDVSDLAVALRHAYRTGAEYNGDPGCTIDPREGADDPFRIQVVKVFAIPRNCPMAARFVTLDYELKKVSSGILAVDSEVRSLFDLRRTASGLCQGETGKQRSSVSVHRFWFHAREPEGPSYFEDDGVVWIRKPVHVKLLTEREFLDSKARRTGGAPADPQAEEFAASITEMLARDELPRYVELRNDYRLLEVAGVLRHKSVPAERLQYLLAEHSIPAVEVPAYVGEIRREERGEVVCETTLSERPQVMGATLESRQHVQQYQQQSRGGVNAKVDVSAPRFTRDTASGLSALRRRVMSARPSASALVWKTR